MAEMKRVGIVGGVGPYASVHFYQRLLQLSGAIADEDYPAAVMVAEQVPSRIAHLLGSGESPLPILLHAVRQLERAGADVIVIPSATTHAYRDELAAAVDVPVGDLLAETGARLRRDGFLRPMILATEATATLRLLERNLARGTVALYPDHFAQRDVGDFITGVKRGDSVVTLKAEFADWIKQMLWRQGGDPDCVVLGCTELSVIAPEVPVSVPIVDVTDVLVRAILPDAAAVHRVAEKQTAGGLAMIPATPASERRRSADPIEIR
jgi:aspartate racemase